MLGCFSRVQLCATPWTAAHQAPVFRREGCHSLLQGIFLTQGSNLGLLHCRWILYHLSHQGHLLYNISTYINKLNHFAHLQLTQHCKSTILQLKIKKKNGHVSNGPVVKTLSFYSRGCGFDPWLWSSDPTTPSSAVKRNKTK